MNHREGFRYLPNLMMFLSVAALVILIAVALNFMVDPLQLLRPARLFAAMYSPDARMQDAGLIRSQQFDTVFMGTSLGNSFSAKRYRQGSRRQIAQARADPVRPQSERSFVLDASLSAAENA